jgi:hypothetical protein
MRKPRPLALLAALALMLTPALAAHGQTLGQTLGQTPPPRLVGAKVTDSKGKPVGQIERVISGPGGQPLQVLVRVDRILRTLPAEALTPTPAGYASVLSRAEIAALPPSE